MDERTTRDSWGYEFVLELGTNASLEDKSDIFILNNCLIKMIGGST